MSCMPEMRQAGISDTEGRGGTNISFYKDIQSAFHSGFRTFIYFSHYQHDKPSEVSRRTAYKTKDHVEYDT